MSELEQPWESFFHWKRGPFYGNVLDVDDATDVIREFSFSTSSSYTMTRCSKNFGSFTFEKIQKWSNVGEWCIHLVLHDQYKTTRLAADIKAPIDARLVAKLNSLVDEGIYNCKEMQRHLKVFVREIFGEEDHPKQFNRRFFPSKGDIQKLIYRRRRKLVHSLIDQENLKKKIDDWKIGNSDDLWFLRQSASVKRMVNEDEECDEGDILKDEEQAFMVVFQSAWQRHLLSRYGKEVVYLDATYRTTRYALPLFFLCVQTNSGYFVVGSFIIEKEDSVSVAEALSVIKDANPEWNSISFMIDASEIEANGIKTVFPDAKIYICDFHRKQAWLRWTNTLKNAVQSPEQTLDMLNNVAESLTVEQYHSNIEQLQQNPLWMKQPRLQDYINKQWLADEKYKSWVWAYRNSALTLVVHTNNGIESQNKVFKYEYLAPLRVKTVSYLMTVMAEDYFVDAHRKYLTSNVTMSAGWREPTENLPEELHHRPLHLVKHMRETNMKASAITADMIVTKDDANYLVTSSKITDHYNVFLGSECDQKLPFCECKEFQRNHMPCKHFAAIFQHVSGISWMSLPDSYRNNPFFTVDTQCVELCSYPTNSTNADGIDNKEIPLSEEEPAVLANETNFNSTLDLQRSAKKVREVLHRINSLTYIVDSAEALDIAKLQLQDVASQLLKTSQSSQGLLLEPPINPCSSKSKVKRKATVLKELPPKKRRKIAISSIKGRQQKENPLISGITTDLLTADESEKTQVTIERKTRKNKGLQSQKNDFCQKKGLAAKQQNQGKPSINEVERNPSTAEDLISKLKGYMESLTMGQWIEIIKKDLSSVDGRRAAIVLEQTQVDESQIISLVKAVIPFKVPDGVLVTVIFSTIANLVSAGEVDIEEDDPESIDNNIGLSMKGLTSCLANMNSNSNTADESKKTQVTIERKHGQNKVGIDNVLKKKSILKITTPKKNSKKTKQSTKTAQRQQKEKKTVTFFGHKNEEKSTLQDYELSSDECEVMLQKLWNRQKRPCHYILAKVHSVNVTDQDILSLRGSTWLTDQVVDAYLDYLVQAYIDQGGNILHVLTRTFTAILNGEYNKSGGTLKKTKLLKKKTLIGAYLQSESHWDLVVVEPFKGVIYLYNPLGETRTLSESILNNWSSFMNARQKKGIENDQKVWKLQCPQHSKQRDSSNCGVYTLMFAERHIQQESCLQITASAVKEMRKKIAVKLLQFSGHLKNCCRCCAWQLQGNQETIQCDQCRAKFHKTNFCVGEANVNKDNFICKACK